MSTKITAIYFSPTQTTEQIVKVVANSVASSTVDFINVTKLEARKEVAKVDDCDLLIIGSPVYSSLTPKLFVDYLKQLKGNDTKTVVISVYGNRSAGSTCRQISDIMTPNGFKTIAAADFIGVHSFSDEKYPIAPGRPDTDDLFLAGKFGDKITELMLRSEQTMAPERLGEAAGESAEIIFQPPTVNENCTNCGVCNTVCPVDIINTGGTDCIGCGACVRICKQNARTFPEKIHEYQIKLNGACQARLEPKIYL